MTSDHIHVAGLRRPARAGELGGAPRRRNSSTAAHTSAMPVPEQRRAGEHPGRPQPAMRRAHEVERVGVVGGGGAAAAGEVAVGLVDDHEVGELHDPALEALQLVAAARRDEHEEEVDHRRDLHLRLPDADRLDEHDVEAGGLAQQHRLARARARRRRGCRRSATGGRTRRASASSCSIRVLSPRIEPPLRVLDGSTASTATRWPCSTRWTPSASMNVDLPGARRAGDADTHRATGVRQHLGEQRLGLGAVVGPRRLDQVIAASARRSPSTTCFAELGRSALARARGQASPPPPRSTVSGNTRSATDRAGRADRVGAGCRPSSAPSRGRSDRVGKRSELSHRRQDRAARPLGRLRAFQTFGCAIAHAAPTQELSEA